MLQDVKELGVFWVTLVLGFRSDLSITRKTDRNSGNVTAVFCFPKSRRSRK